MTLPGILTAMNDPESEMNLARILGGLTCIIAVFAFVGSALATDTRINSLSGGSVAMTPTLSFNEKLLSLDDSAAVYLLPQTLLRYRNSVDADAGGVGTFTTYQLQPDPNDPEPDPAKKKQIIVPVQNQTGYGYGTLNIRYALSDDAVMLVFGKRSPWSQVVKRSSLGGLDAGFASGYQPTVADPTNHQLGLGFAMKAGESLRLGAYMSMGGHKAEGDGSNQHNETLLDFGAGLGFDINETNSLDFGIGFRNGSFTDTTAAITNFESQGLLGVNFQGRGKFQVHQIAKLIPFLAVSYDSRAVQAGAQTTPPGTPPKYGRYTGMAFNAGTDLAIQPVDGVIIQPGFGLGLMRTNVNGNNDNTTSWDQEVASRQLFHYGFAAEAKSFSWMVLRLGARQTVLQDTFGATSHNGATVSQEAKKSFVVNKITTGMGFRLLGWEFDLNVDPSFYQNGVMAASGTPTLAFAVDWALFYRW